MVLLVGEDVKKKVVKYPCIARYEYPDGKVAVKQHVYEVNIKDAEKVGVKVTVL